MTVRTKGIFFVLISFICHLSSAQVSTGTTTVGYNGGGSHFAPCTEILRFDNYNDLIAQGTGGQSFAFVLGNGDSLFFNLQRNGYPAHAVAAPCWSSASFGAYGYTGLLGSPVIYQSENTGGDDTQFQFDSIILKDHSGQIINDFTMMVFDAESTGPWESITLTAPNPLVWSYYDSVAPSVPGYTRPGATGLGTNVVSWMGTYPDNVTVYLDYGFSIHAPPGFLASLANDGSSAGLEGFAIGINRRISALNDTSCTGGNFIIKTINASPGTTYTWGNPVINPPGSVTGAAAQATPVDSIKQNLQYAGGGVATVTYNITPTSCGVAGRPFTATIVLGLGTGPVSINLGRDTTYCGPFSRVLSTSIPNAVWSTGITASQITVSTPGTYWAQSTTGCGTSSDTIRISQNQVPNIHLGNDTALCLGQSLLLNAANANSTYHWQNNSNSSTFEVTVTGTYSVTVTNSAGCSANDNIQVNFVTQLPAINLGNDTVYCGNFSRTLSTGFANTFWSTGATSAQIAVTASGIYWAKETNACGFTTDTITISQNPVPVVNLGNDTTLCAGQLLVLNATSQNSAYVWQDNSTNGTFSVTTAGTYAVTGTNSFSCMAADSIVVGYDSGKPAFNLGIDTTYCQQFSRILSTGIANTFWSTNIVAPQITVDSGAIYWAEATNACGANRDSIVVNQSAPPEVTFTGSYSVCPGDTVILHPVTNGTAFLWDNGDTTNSIYVSQPGNYVLKAWNNINCPAYESISVPIGSPPVISLGNDTSICGDAGITLSLNVPNAHYLWQDNSTDSFYRVNVSGTYSVSVTTNCGTANAQRIVEIYPNECVLAIPSAFTPNGDGKNDVFKVISLCPVSKFWMHIYNRWGQLVFESNNIANGWDGTFKGVAQSVGTFTYYTEYFNYCKGAMDKKSGNITLLH